MGVLPGETQQEAGDELRHAVGVATWADELIATVNIRPGGHRGAETPITHPLVQAFVVQDDTAPQVGQPTGAGTMVCDGKIMQGGGWASSVVHGPVGGGLHSADEWVDLRSVNTLIELVVRGTQRFLG